MSSLQKEMRNVQWMVPLHWVQQIVMNELHDNAPPPAFANQFMQELKAYRVSLRKLFSYDWICVPLVYTQVIYTSSC